MSIPGLVFVSERACGTNYVITQGNENIRLMTTLQTAENNKNKHIIHTVDVEDILLVLHLDYHNISLYHTVRRFIPSCFIIAMKDCAK